MKMRWYYSLHWLVLILLGLAIYGQTFGFGFVFDDSIFIVNNPYIKSLDHVQYLWKSFPETRTVGFYSFALNYYFSQLHPQAYHIFNFAVHLLATGLVWACARVLFKLAGEEPQELPFIIALLFLVHPGQTQAVTYISQRFESMATVFYLGSIYCYLRARLTFSREWKASLFICSAGLAILGIFTKEVAATIPLMIAAIEWIFFNRNYKKKDLWKICAVFTAGGFCFFILFMKLARTDLNVFFHFNPEPSGSHGGDIITAKNYLLTQMRVFLTFIRLLVLPIRQNLDYDYPLSTGLLNPPLTLVGLGVILGFIFLVFRLRRQWPLISFGLAWVLITFSINIAPRANVIFEHKLYLISFGFFTAAVCGLSAAIKDRKILYGILLSVVAVLSVMGFSRNQVWKDQLTLWNDVIQKSPHKARAYNNRGLAYFYQGNLIGAMSDYNKAIEIKPDYSEAYSDRGLVYYDLGNPAKAMVDYDKALEIDPRNAQALNNRGIVYGNQGNLIRAMADYNKAIEINPYNAQARYNRGNIYDEGGDLGHAMADYDKAVEIDPDFTESYYNRGLLFVKRGNYSQAILDFNKAIEINPGDPEFYISRGDIFAQRSDYSRAVLDYNKAIGINSGYAEAYNKRGFYYSQKGDLTQAMADYNRAIAINPNFAQAYEGRAGIYYQLKEYDSALEDVYKVEALGIKVDPEFLKNLKNASGKGQ